MRSFTPLDDDRYQASPFTLSRLIRCDAFSVISKPVIDTDSRNSGKLGSGFSRIKKARPFSFEDGCDVLGVDPARLRDLIFRWTQCLTTAAGQLRQILILFQVLIRNCDPWLGLNDNALPVSDLAIVEVHAVAAAHRFVRLRIHSRLRRGHDLAARTTTLQSPPTLVAPGAAAPQHWFDSNE